MNERARLAEVTLPTVEFQLDKQTLHAFEGETILRAARRHWALGSLWLPGVAGGGGVACVEVGGLAGDRAELPGNLWQLPCLPRSLP